MVSVSTRVKDAPLKSTLRMTYPTHSYDVDKSQATVGGSRFLSAEGSYNALLTHDRRYLSACYLVAELSLLGK